MRRLTWLLAGVLLVGLWFGVLGVRALYVPDEGRYAEIPREMLATGDFVTPRLNGFPYFDKPPLQYWITAASYALFGENEWSARLWNTLAAFLSVIAVVATARRLFSRRAGWIAGAVLASSCGYFVAGQFLTLDMGLTLFLTCAMCAFVLAQDRRASATAERGFMLAAWGAAALAVLSKGLIGVVLPALALVVYTILARDASPLRRLQIVAGLPLFAAIVVPWFVLVEWRNPGFSAHFFLHEHFGRFTNTELRRSGPWWYFLPILLVYLMPWLPTLLRNGWRPPPAMALRAPGFDARLFLWCWAGSILLFFSISSSKLPAYILPVYPAIVLAASGALARRWRRTLTDVGLVCAVMGVMVAAIAVPAIGWIRTPAVRDAYAGSVWWMVAAGTILAATGVLTIVLMRRHRGTAALAATVLGVTLACQTGAWVAHRTDGWFSSRQLIERVAGGERIFRPAVPFYTVDTFDHTVPFYLGRTVTMVRERGELAHGIAIAPAGYIPELHEFVAAWLADREAWAVMTPSTFEDFSRSGLPMRRVDDDGRRVIVSRH